MTIEGHEEILGHVRCIKQFVQIVDRNVKFRSNRQRTDQYTVVTVTRNIENTNHIIDFFLLLFFLLYFIYCLLSIKYRCQFDFRSRL